MYKTTGLINNLIIFQRLYKIPNDVKGKILSFYNSKNKTLLEEQKLIKPKLEIESKYYVIKNVRNLIKLKKEKREKQWR